MARARLLKPGFFTNEELADLGPWARLLFAGLWTLADREGRLDDRPKRIKAALFPYDDVDVDRELAALVAAGLVCRYGHGAGRHLHIPTFLRHQSPHFREPPSALPPCMACEPQAPPGLNGEKPEAEGRWNGYEPWADETSNGHPARARPRAGPAVTGNRITVAETVTGDPETETVAETDDRARPRRAAASPPDVPAADGVAPWDELEGERLDVFRELAMSLGDRVVYDDLELCRDLVLICADYEPGAVREAKKAIRRKNGRPWPKALRDELGAIVEPARGPRALTEAEREVAALHARKLPSAEAAEAVRERIFAEEAQAENAPKPRRKATVPS